MNITEKEALRLASFIYLGAYKKNEKNMYINISSDAQINIITKSNKTSQLFICKNNKRLRYTNQGKNKFSESSSIEDIAASLQSLVSTCNDLNNEVLDIDDVPPVDESLLSNSSFIEANNELAPEPVNIDTVYNSPLPSSPIEGNPVDTAIERQITPVFDTPTKTTANNQFTNEGENTMYEQPTTPISSENEASMPAPVVTPAPAYASTPQFTSFNPQPQTFAASPVKDEAIARNLPKASHNDVKLVSFNDELMNNKAELDERLCNMIHTLCDESPESAITLYTDLLKTLIEFNDNDPSVVSEKVKIDLKDIHLNLYETA